MDVVYRTADAVSLDAAAPSRSRFLLRVDAFEMGAAIEVPVHLLTGRSVHPRLAIVGGVHGDEYDGILAAQRLLQEVDPGRLAGTLAVIPVANPSAHGAAQRHTPLDGLDLNRVFPGRADGGVTERLAYLLCQGMLRHMDLVFTMHGARSPNRLAHWIEFLDEPSAVGRASRAAAEASGFTDLIALPRKPGHLLGALAEFGVPVIEAEVGGRGETNEANVQCYLERLHAILGHAGLEPESKDARVPPDRPAVWRNVDVLATTPGILLSEVALRDRVRSGQRLARIVDGEGAPVGDVTAPCDGIIGALRVHAGTRPGDILFRVWVPVEE